MIQRTPVVEYKLRIRKYGDQVQPEDWKDKKRTHFVHHHCQSVDVCFLSAARTLKAKLLRKE